MSEKFSVRTAKRGPDLASMPRRADTEQSRCLLESVLRVLRDHVRDGDRWQRLTTELLIERDCAAIATMRGGV